MTLYRDPLAGLRSQIATKRGALESHERRLATILRALLPAELRETLRQNREAALSEGESMEDLSRADSALDAMIAAYESAERILPGIRICPEEVKDPPKPAQAPPWIIEERPQLELRALFEKTVKAVDAGAYVVRWGDHTYLARLRVVGAPMIATCRAEIIPTEGVVTAFRSALRTSMPDEIPSLELRRERTVDRVGRRFGLVEDHRIGQDEVDEAFLVRGNVEALPLVSPDVGAALLSLLPYGPRLTVGRGLVELSWGDAVQGARVTLLPDSAFQVVLGMRAVLERA